MSDYDAALAEASRLSELSDDALLEELGLRVEAKQLPGGEMLVASFDADFTVVATEMGAGGDLLRKIGRRWWENLEPQLMAMLCDPANPDTLKITGNRSIPQIAAGLAVAGLTSIVAPPAWLIVAATILAAKIADSGVKALCQTWAEASAGRAAPQAPPDAPGADGS
jgi:hypothetical protein